MNIGQSEHLFNSLNSSSTNETKSQSLGVEKLTPNEVNKFKEEINSYQQQVAIDAIENFNSQFLGFNLGENSEIFELNEIEKFDIEAIKELAFNEDGSFDSDGYFGIAQTSTRLADFVINGANGDIDLLRAGKEGIKSGYDEAQRIFGDELPQISQDTLGKAIETINEQISKLGFNILDIRA